MMKNKLLSVLSNQSAMISPLQLICYYYLLNMGHEEILAYVQMGKVLMLVYQHCVGLEA